MPAGSHVSSGGPEDFARLAVVVETALDAIDSLRIELKEASRERATINSQTALLEQTVAKLRTDVEYLLVVIRDGNARPSMIERMTAIEAATKPILEDLTVLSRRLSRTHREIVASRDAHHKIADKLNNRVTLLAEANPAKILEARGKYLAGILSVVSVVSGILGGIATALVTYLRGEK